MRQIDKILYYPFLYEQNTVYVERLYLIDIGNSVIRITKLL